MTTSTPKQPRIRALLGYGSLVDGEVLAQGVAAQAGISVNTKEFPLPPVSMTDFGTLLTTYNGAIAASIDGGKQAISFKNEQREAVINVLRQLAPYVEANCNGVMSTFTSSGFIAASTTRNSPKPLSLAAIRKVDQGNSGTLLITVTALRGAISYEVRYAPIVNGIPGAWTVATATKAKSAVPIAGLTPATSYAFQVRALGRSGYTDWSDSATRICI